MKNLHVSRRFAVISHLSLMSAEFLIVLVLFPKQVYH